MSAPGLELAGRIPGAVAEDAFDTLTVTVPVSRWLEAATLARDELGCDYLDMLCGVDEGPAGLAVVAHLCAVPAGGRLLLRTVVPARSPQVPSLTGLFRGAAWHEREAAEMFGLLFTGGPDTAASGPVRLLLPPGFLGQPLRKDFVLVARVVRPWPGAEEPGGQVARRPQLPPGVPAGWPVESAPQEGPQPGPEEGT